jgi:prophage regulatory protein
MKTKFLRITDVMSVTGLAKSTIWLYVKEGKFPKQIKLSPKISVWKESDVEAWITEQIEKGVA